MEASIRQIADLVDAELVGSSDIIITGISGIKEAKEGDITFLANSKYASLLNTTKASAIITSKDIIDNTNKTLLKTNDPSVAFTKVVSLLAPSVTNHPKGIHPSSVISPKAKLGNNVSIGACAVIDDDVCLGDGTIIYGGCYIGHETKIGKNCLLYPNVSIRERIDIGNRVIIHSGSVIGSDGFGFSMVRGIQQKIPQIGIVQIEDDVEIGANVAIDRARFDKTVIGKGTKIDNLVQIAHNVVTGKNCIIVAQTGISGSSILGDNVVLAGQVGIIGHVKIGEKTIVAARSGVTKSILPGAKVWGFPSKPLDIAKKINACVQRLPDLYKKIKELEEKVKHLEEKE
ncbi:MAG: UDP-3-O-(3-hydroxymyristoyl)glucosamine N-acyltransferase [Candidatus Omnitrophica bacterium]|nr:UDP-3-O-(3-hydroxymyristoyl)glucosamine N-acyltransferase [Candidatus Omnitrophota bacterium]